MRQPCDSPVPSTLTHRDREGTERETEHRPESVLNKKRERTSAVLANVVQAANSHGLWREDNRKRCALPPLPFCVDLSRAPVTRSDKRIACPQFASQPSEIITLFVACRRRVAFARHHGRYRNGRKLAR